MAKVTTDQQFVLRMSSLEASVLKAALCALSIDDSTMNCADQAQIDRVKEFEDALLDMHDALAGARVPQVDIPFTSELD